RDTGDPRDMWIALTILANQDALVYDAGNIVSSGLPAFVSKTSIEKSNQYAHRESWQELRIIFDDQGNIVVQDPRNDWLHSRASQSGPELYPPAFLLRVEPPRLVPRTGTTLEFGNIEVGQELVLSKMPLATVRARYRSKK